MVILCDLIVKPNNLILSIFQYMCMCMHMYMCNMCMHVMFMQNR